MRETGFSPPSLMSAAHERVCFDPKLQKESIPRWTGDASCDAESSVELSRNLVDRGSFASRLGTGGGIGDRIDAV